ncbi:MAG: tetratricopeptide repeat protein [Flavobacteriaceae bacterium]|nr:tetratricopeptide repeat protein [Flavobacteriaceae bacterium]
MITPPHTEEKRKVLELLEKAYVGRVNNLALSIEQAKEALSISCSINDKSLQGSSLNKLSLYYMISGEYQLSLNAAKEAIVYFELLNDERGIADAKYNIAGGYNKTDKLHMGLVNLVDCITIYKRYEDHHNISRSEKSLGCIYQYFGDQKNAEKSYENAIEAAKKVGDAHLESDAYNNLSDIYLKQGKVDESLELVQKSIALKEKYGDTSGVAFAVYCRGKINVQKGMLKEAESDFLESIKVHLQTGEQLRLGMSYRKLGELYLKMGEIEKAKSILNEGVEVSTKYNIVIIKFKCYYLLYQLFKQENDPEKALECLELYLREKEAMINIQTLQVVDYYELITQMKLLEREAELQRAKADRVEKENKATQSATVRQEFLSTMSHEIRTPLNAVTTIALLLQDKANPEDKKMFDSLKFSSDNLVQIINDILNYSELDAGNEAIKVYPSDLKNFLENIINVHQSLAEERGLELDLDIDIHFTSGHEFDETKLSQILGNLINNAIKFTDKGKVNLVIEKTSSETGYDTIRFKVKDTGEGISESLRSAIFESFSQVKKTTTRKRGGTGLGLAIVEKLVRLHNSKIFVDSIPGQGSEFYFDLKLKKCKLPERTSVKIGDQLKGKTILLAEDNLINALVAQKLLGNWGATTEHALNGIIAIEKAKLKVYDFILMDLHMPIMNGFDATENIRTKKSLNTKTPIFAFTADITAEQHDEYVGYFTGFLWKPLEIARLQEALVCV